MATILTDQEEAFVEQSIRLLGDVATNAAQQRDKQHERAKNYRRELKRVNAAHRLLVLEHRALKERYANLLRLGVANEDGARQEGYESGYQSGFFDGEEQAKRTFVTGDLEVPF